MPLLPGDVGVQQVDGALCGYPFAGCGPCFLDQPDVGVARRDVSRLHSLAELDTAGQVDVRPVPDGFDGLGDVGVELCDKIWIVHGGGSSIKRGE